MYSLINALKVQVEFANLPKVIIELSYNLNIDMGSSYIAANN